MSGDNKWGCICFVFWPVKGFSMKLGESAISILFQRKCCDCILPLSFTQNASKYHLNNFVPFTKFLVICLNHFSFILSSFRNQTLHKILLLTMLRIYSNDASFQHFSNFQLLHLLTVAELSTCWKFIYI